MSTKVLKTAVVGLGRIGWSFHLPQIVEHPGFRLTAVVDPLEERLAEARERFRPDAAYRDSSELYGTDRPDLVVIASPTQFHKAQVLQAFENGCDVFCDKPLALTLAEADEIISAMEEYGRKLMVYQPHRVTPEVLALQAVLRSGLLGDLYLMRHCVSRYARRNDWQAFRRHGGGMLNNYGAHFIDQFLFLNRSPFRSVACEMRAVATVGDAEDVVKALLTAENGVIFDLEINMAAAAPQPPWYVAGSHGAAILDSEARTWRVTCHDPHKTGELNPQEGLAAYNRSYGSGETIQWKQHDFKVDDYEAGVFYESCHAYFAGEGEPIVPVSETREVMRVMRECRLVSGWQE